MTRVPRKYSDQYRLRNQELPADADSRALTALRRAIRGIPVDAEDFRSFFTRYGLSLHYPPIVCDGLSLLSVTFLDFLLQYSYAKIAVTHEFCMGACRCLHSAGRYR
jgi:hypothetical protein